MPTCSTSTQLSTNLSFFGPKVKKHKNKALNTHKCMLENWLSLGSENGEIEVVTAAKSCVGYENIIHACCIRFQATIISERHTRGIHKNVIQRRNPGSPLSYARTNIRSSVRQKHIKLTSNALVSYNTITTVSHIHVANSCVSET